MLLLRCRFGMGELYASGDRCGMWESVTCNSTKWRHWFFFVWHWTSIQFPFCTIVSNTFPFHNRTTNSNRARTTLLGSWNNNIVTNLPNTPGNDALKQSSVVDSTISYLEPHTFSWNARVYLFTYIERFISWSQSLLLHTAVVNRNQSNTITCKHINVQWYWC